MSKLREAMATMTVRRKRLGDVEFYQPSAIQLIIDAASQQVELTLNTFTSPIIGIFPQLIQRFVSQITALILMCTSKTRINERRRLNCKSYHKLFDVNSYSAIQNQNIYLSCHVTGENSVICYQYCF